VEELERQLDELGDQKESLLEMLGSATQSASQADEVRRQLEDEKQRLLAQVAELERLLQVRAGGARL
jgi:cell division septum initiation protein DivIVA